MKRTGIFAAAVAGAVGATALVGGVGYTLAQEVAEQHGVPLDLGPIASVEPGNGALSTSTGRGQSTDGDTGDAAPGDTTPDETAGGTGTEADSPAAGGAAPVAPAPPVAIDPGKQAGPPAHPWRTRPPADRRLDDPREYAPPDHQNGWTPDPGRGGGGGTGTDEPRRGGGDGHEGAGRPGGGGPGGGHHGGGHHGGHH